MRLFRLLTAALALICLGGCQNAPRAAADYRADQEEARNMRLVGANDLQARNAYQPVVIEQQGRWIAYIGHAGGIALNPQSGVREPNGTSIVDVTDPKNPRYLVHIPGDANGHERGADMVRLCHGRDLPKGARDKIYLLRTFGQRAHEIWDVTAPEKPELITRIGGGYIDTHKNWWECDTGIAYLVSGVPGWRLQRRGITQVYDLSDPAKPVYIRDFGLVSQLPNSSGVAQGELHGPISLGPKGNRIYFGYGAARDGVMQIVDREKLIKGPKEPTVDNLRYPLIAQLDLPGFIAAHSTLPVLGIDVPAFAKDDRGQRRDFVFIVNESVRAECIGETRQMAYVVDITDEKHPFPVANIDVPEASGDFCSRGGNFGAHAVNENQPPMYAKRVLFFSWYNAGVRAVDIRNPYSPREIGYYIPAVTDKTDPRCVTTAAGKHCKTAIQTNNVEVDDRGYIYIVDRANTGLHILELTGEARAVADFR
jgi:hypothetical protein